MGIETLTRRNDGTLVAPTSDTDWESWVGATDIRNFMLRDPVVDWLELYGTAVGFQQDTKLATFDKRTSLPVFAFRQSAAFEDAVVSHIGTLLSEVVSLLEITVVDTHHPVSYADPRESCRPTPYGTRGPTAIRMAGWRVFRAGGAGLSQLGQALQTVFPDVTSAPSNGTCYE